MPNFLSNNVAADPLIRMAWPQLTSDFRRTIKRLKRLSQIIESEVEAARMRWEGEKHDQVLCLLKRLQETSTKKDVIPLYHVPLGLNEKVLWREAEIQKIHDSLDQKVDSRASKSLALHGMGGVGKTAIALQYATSARDRYDAIFWISADDRVKMSQDFLDIAQKLDLIPQDRKSEDGRTAMTKVKTWLNEASKLAMLLFYPKKQTNY